jgi:hypothetical protein
MNFLSSNVINMLALKHTVGSIQVAFGGGELEGPDM